MTDTEGGVATCSACSRGLTTSYGVQQTLPVDSICCSEVDGIDKPRYGTNLERRMATDRYQKSGHHCAHNVPRGGYSPWTRHLIAQSYNPGELGILFPGELTLHLAIPLPHSHVSAHCGGAGNQILLSLVSPGPRGPGHTIL